MPCTPPPLLPIARGEGARLSLLAPQSYYYTLRCSPIKRLGTETTHPPRPSHQPTTSSRRTCYQPPFLPRRPLRPDQEATGPRGHPFFPPLPTYYTQEGSSTTHHITRHHAVPTTTRGCNRRGNGSTTNFAFRLGLSPIVTLKIQTDPSSSPTTTTLSSPEQPILVIFPPMHG